jgi:hypothetical protein
VHIPRENAGLISLVEVVVAGVWGNISWFCLESTASDIG